jgi:pimeloyl-ACP methyl ester carboxylesterase
MTTLFALIHSPLVGPFTWSRVADELRQRGVEVVVPELKEVEGRQAPYWQQHSAAAAETLLQLPKDRSVILVGHSGAGSILPAIRVKIDQPVAGYVFVDAGIPIAGLSRLGLMAEESPQVEADFRNMLESGESFPNWKDEDLAEIIPDPDVRGRLLAELHPRPLEFFEEPIPVFAEWPDAPCGYLLFSPAYNAYAERAQREGWAFRRIDAGHFHILVEPKQVADALMDLTQEMRTDRNSDFSR